eukprot:7339194-Prorocentrum_lima.AAC.1
MGTRTVNGTAPCRTSTTGQGCTAADFQGKGIYPLNKNSWWLAQPAARPIIGNEPCESSNKYC